ncbi:MAG: hypothetical protein IPK19_22260 [Chloroflexi bacterium]|nr:hypothetical protein [Chloroflexota bacterium]
MSSSFPIQPFPGIAKRAETEEASAGGSSSTGNPMEIISAGFDALIAQIESGHYESHAAPVKKPRPERKKPATPRASAPARRKKRRPSDDID